VRSFCATWRKAICRITGTALPAPAPAAKRGMTMAATMPRTNTKTTKPTAAITSTRDAERPCCSVAGGGGTANAGLSRPQWGHAAASAATASLHRGQAMVFIG
jgi:hypothetical protein